MMIFPACSEERLILSMPKEFAHHETLFDVSIFCLRQDLFIMPDIDKQSLADILLASRRAASYAETITEDFFSVDQNSQDILIRQMTILGEAFRRLSSEFGIRHPELPYGIIIAMRNVLVHDYDGIILPDVWYTIKNDLPNLISTIEKFYVKNTIFYFEYISHILETL